MFGYPMEMGTATLAIVRDMIGVIRSEEDLENLLHSQINAEQYVADENITEHDKENIKVEKVSQMALSNNTIKNKIKEDIIMILKKNDIYNVTIDVNVTRKTFSATIAGCSCNYRVNTKKD
ncbi:unnamed protein product [Parnassius apollo]|uniref:(apollo) hypothetical protein n=1 Tax=Parnassius apollo TaxID=110799 RepID=A0A8S3Y464_PARAO|nr:unnamed protein product [Parnassius apollo]